MSRRQTAIAFVAILIAAAQGFTACGSPHLTAGNNYFARGNLPVAIEYFDAGLVKDGGNQQLREALILGQQTYLRNLQREVDELQRAGRFHLAVSRLTLIEETSRRAEALGLPGEMAIEIDKERTKLVSRAIDELEQDLDTRAGRGTALQSDLAACRQFQALATGDESVARRCASLLDKFKHYTEIKVSRRAIPAAAQLPGPITTLVQQRHPELFEVVAAGHGKLNTTMELFVGQPVSRELDWHLVERDSFYTWIPRKTKKGKLIYEMVTVRLTDKQIKALKAQQEQEKRRAAAAKRKFTPTPIKTSKKVKKQVFDRVKGEYRHYGSSREVVLPYAVTLEDLRDGRIIATFSGVLRAASQTRYHEFSGDSRARRKMPASAGPEGRHKAKAPLPETVLIDQSLRGLPNRVVDSTLKQIE